MSPQAPTQTLRNQLDNLPQEIYDDIYELVFIAKPSVVQIIYHKDYDFPRLLHVDQVSRATYAKSYFSNTSFIFADVYQATLWLCLLSRDHIDLCTKVVLAMKCDEGSYEWRDQKARLWGWTPGNVVDHVELVGTSKVSAVQIDCMRLR